MFMGVIALAMVAPVLGVCPSSVRPQPAARSPSWSVSFSLPARLTPVPAPWDSITAPGLECLTPADTTPASAIAYSHAYYTRRTIHHIGAIAMLPLFVTEYILGQKLINDSTPSSGLKTAHGIVAGGIGAVFVTNTVTGAWNWLDSRRDPTDRTLRNVHAAIMLASDVGFVWAAASAPGSIRHTPPAVRQHEARRHRAIAITSIAVSTVGAAIMGIFQTH